LVVEEFWEMVVIVVAVVLVEVVKEANSM